MNDIHYENNYMTILKTKDQNGKRGTKRGPLLAFFLKKSLRWTKNPKRDLVVITVIALLEIWDHVGKKAARWDDLSKNLPF